MRKTLTTVELEHHAKENGIKLTIPDRIDYIVIRGENGDYGVAALHVDGYKLVLDLGHKLSAYDEHHAELTSWLDKSSKGGK